MGNELIPISDADYQMPVQAEASAVPASSLRLSQFLSALKKFWWIPLLTLAIGLTLGISYIRRLDPVYVSTASMWETLKMHLPDESIYSGDAENLLGTQIELLQSEKMHQLALDRLKSMTNSAGFFPGKDDEPPAVAVQVNMVPKSSIFQLQAVSSDPAFTQNYLDALMLAFLDYDKDTRNKISEFTITSLNDQMQTLEQDLKTEQDALMAYEQTNNLGILQQEESVAGGYLEKLQTQLSDLELEAKLLQTGENDNKKAAAGGTNEPIPIAAFAAINSSASTTGPASPNPASPANSTDLELMKMQYAELTNQLQPNSEKLSELKDAIKRAEDLEKVNRSQAARQAAEQLSAYLQANQIKIQYVTNSIKEWQAKLTEANARLAEADHLKLNIQRTQSVYDRLTSLSENLGISRSIDQESLAILESASPAYRSHVAERRDVGVAAFGGLASGLLIIFLLGIRDDRFTSIAAVNSALGDAVVGMVPRITGEKNGVLRLLEPNDQRHIYAESYRSLRSALRFLETGENRPKTILITSATPNEGKSTVSANLAHTLAMAGYRVLLVDGDLRKGHLHHLLKLQNEFGLTELLSGSCGLEQVLQVNSLPNLSFISRGKISSGNTGDLLLSHRLDELLGQWRREFDYVLIDSSPVFATADAGSLAPRVDGTLFLVRSHHSGARATREALEMLVQRRARIIGVVFNMADVSGRTNYHYKYAEYYPPSQSG
jgi:polysaccharide biosynthesis transport protein